ncbi:MAG: PepSY-associated TM helix domain-containing protein [Deltaproteobacteria bacterium]|nr:PepSY-associated TM helix domain-containing protein [Deltaproteobacteria bacterium]
MKWRKLFRALHRDIGYVVAALTLAYSISGIAVNHIEDWNPNYKFDDEAVAIGALPAGDLPAMESHVVSSLKIPLPQVRGHFQESDSQFRVFLTDGQEIKVDIATGNGTFKKLSTRPMLFELNALHLNNLKGIWTWIADLFALSLIVLVITGLLMMKGKRGLAGRGKWFVGAGLLVPIAFVFYLYSGN